MLAHKKMSDRDCTIRTDIARGGGSLLFFRQGGMGNPCAVPANPSSEVAYFRLTISLNGRCEPR